MTKNNQEEKNQKVLFYTGISRAFRTTSIAHLYEISQVWPVVLLSEELDKETETILKDKTLFPKLEKIIPARQFTGEKRNLFSENIYVHKLAKDIIKNYKPAVVILPTDTYLFDFYLMRFAKKINAVNIILNSDLRLSTAKEMSLRTDLTHSYFGLPQFFPFRLRFLLVKARKYLGYFIYNWILPLLARQSPFLGKSSRILYSMPGERADYRIVCSKQDYDLSVKGGIAEKKLILLEHPLKRENTKRFFEKAYFLNFKNKTKNKTKTFTLLYPEELYGFKRDDYSLISEEETKIERVKIVNLIVNTLKGWKIFIKPHPATPKAEELKNIFEAISPSITFTDPYDPIERYIGVSDVIAGLPPSSSALLTAAWQCPNKPILSLDLDKEVMGDGYKDLSEVEHIDTEEKLISVLGAIRDDKYQKNYKEKEVAEGFSSTLDFLDYLLRNKKLC